jgi:integrase
MCHYLPGAGAGCRTFTNAHGDKSLTDDLPPGGACGLYVRADAQRRDSAIHRVYRDLRGRQRSAGTYPSRRLADKAWQRAEVKLELGRTGDPGLGRQTFRQYVEETWLPNHEMEATTRQGYTYVLYKHLMPEFGTMRMMDILPMHVREWVTGQKALGLSPATIAGNKVILSAIFTTALNDQVTVLHPCKGVKIPPVPVKPRTIITPEQFAELYAAIPGAQSQLLVETAIETGLRWGELTELRGRDIEFATRMLTVSRAVVTVQPRFHPEGGRFLVKEYPKDREYRRLKLSTQITAKLKVHVAEHGCSRDDLIFQLPPDGGPRIRKPRLTADPDALGRTKPNPEGRTYRHGTLTGYSLGRCRCDYCRGAYTQYRAERRARGKDDPREPRSVDTDGHIPGNWFRAAIWKPAIKAAGLTMKVRLHDLRHAHASWLLAGGADLQVVRQRLGHSSLRTTERYLHTLPDADETALDALAKIRGRGSRG